jgi:CheY-like chemotaxis protein
MSKTPTQTSVSPAAVKDVSDHVLVVDDDDMVREHAVRQLLALGYQVSEAPDGPTGLEIIHQRADIDLLFTDMVMAGGMSGRDLAEAAVRLRPGLRILFTSGHGEESIVLGGQLGQGFELLQKPYRRSELARRLRNAPMALGVTTPA